MRDNQAQRLSVDTHAAREARLQSVRDRHRGCLWRLMLLAREARLQVLKVNQAQI